MNFNFKFGLEFNIKKCKTGIMQLDKVYIE